MYVRDLAGEEYPIMATYTISDELNGNMDMSLDLLPNNVNCLFLSQVESLWEIIDDNDEIWKIIYNSAKAEGEQGTVRIRAIPKLYDDLDMSRVYEKYEGSYPVEQLFSIVFQGSGYTHNLIGAWSSIEIEGFGDGDTRLSMFQHLLNRVGAEFTFTMNSVTIKERIGVESQVMYRYRLNASNIVSEVDAQELWTFAKGFGNFDESKPEEAKLKREYTSPLAKLLGKREAPPIKDGRVKVAATMDKSLKKLVDESIKLSVSADLVDLSSQGYPYAHTGLGDTVLLMDERIGLQEDLRVAARTISRDWLGKILDLKFTFGTDGLSKRYQAKMSNAMQQITDILDGRKKLPFQAMSDEIQILTQLMQSMQTQLSISENGSLVATDTKNPNNVVIYGSGGLFVSDDGGQTVKAAITGRGIMGDTIIANSITADKLTANAITVGFNTNSTNLKLYANRLEFFKNNEMTGRITEDGHEFWYGTLKIGRMGEINKLGSQSIRGVALNLEYTGDFVSFGRKTTSTAETYTNMLTLDPVGKFTGLSGAVFEMPIYVRGNEISGVRNIKPIGSGTEIVRYGYTAINGVGSSPMIGNNALTAGIAFVGSTTYLISNGSAYRVEDLYN